MDDLNQMAKLHSAGATVRHDSPFADLPTHKNEIELSADFIKKWVALLYLDTIDKSENFKRHLENWRLLEQKRKLLENQNALAFVKLLEQQEEGVGEDYLQSLSSFDNDKGGTFSIDYFAEQITILKNLSQYNC